MPCFFLGETIKTLQRDAKKRQWNLFGGAPSLSGPLHRWFNILPLLQRKGYQWGHWSDWPLISLFLFFPLFFPPFLGFFFFKKKIISFFTILNTNLYLFSVLKFHNLAILLFRQFTIQPFKLFWVFNYFPVFPFPHFLFANFPVSPISYVSVFPLPHFPIRPNFASYGSSWYCILLFCQFFIFP